MKKVACFISIPKNASKTIHNFLGIPDWLTRDDVGSPYLSENHLPIELLVDAYREKHGGDFESLFTFCFCRNPYDRAVSWFFYHHQLSNAGNFPDLHMYQTTFREWVLQGCPNHYKHGFSQCFFIEGYESNLDFIGRMETFEEDMKRLQEILKSTFVDQQVAWTLNPDVYTRKNNVSSHKDYEEYYDEELKEKVYKIFQQDFEFFGYEA